VQSCWQAAALFLYVVGNEPAAAWLYMTSGHLVENVNGNAHMGKRLTSNVFCDEAVCMWCITTIDFGGFQLWEFSGCLENVGFQRFSRFSSEVQWKKLEKIIRFVYLIFSM
jgi:hypothetical protein